MNQNYSLKWAFAALCLMIGSVCFATHITGGEITYTYTGGGNYEITLTVYRDCGPDNTNQTGFDNPSYVGIYQDGILISTLNIFLTEAVVTLLPYGISDDCLVLPPDVCIEQCIYTTTANLGASPNGYDLVYVRCCRSPAIINLDLPQDTGMTCHTHIPGTNETTGTNSSPVFTNLPPSLLCLNESFSMDHSATDADGDSISYALCLPYHGASFFEPQPLPYASFDPVPVTWAAGYNDAYPIASSPAFSIDPVTGVFSGTPSGLGKWVFAICATEWRNGVPINFIRRDYMIQVLQCSSLYVAAIPEIEPCIGMTIDFGNNSEQATEWAWDFGVEDEVADTSDLENPEYTYQDTGYYQITLIAQPGVSCADTAIQTIAVFPPLELALSLDDSYCEDGMMFFDISQDGNYTSDASFNWIYPPGSSPSGSTDEAPTPFGNSQEGTWNVVLEIEDHGCEISASIPVDVPALPIVEIDMDSEPCTGYTLSFSSEMENCISGVWDFGAPGNGDVSTQSDPSYTYGAFGSYTVTFTGTASSGCTDTATMEVFVSDDDPLEMGYQVNAPLPCAGDSSFYFQFTGTGNTSLEWNFGDGAVSADNPVDYTYDETGDYEVTLTIVNDICDVEESIVIDVNYDNSIPELHPELPNIITPDGDNRNERLRPFDRALEAVNPDASLETVFAHMFLQVYDRWGVLMYEGSDLRGWDGRFNGELVHPGVYYYIAEFQLVCGETMERREGFVHVVMD
ncbi:MAG: PKD domain-containing protein [Flavobacteriales bacterium]|nr:PKD domain-containing protein [Flavobacteriales bacterium]